MASSSYALPDIGCTYDAFLSFRGEDTRYNFVDHLYTALNERGIRVFKDDNELPLGEPISTELVAAIEESMYAVIVFSKNYAESSWCLDEVAKIMECRQRTGLKVLSVFYYVEPSAVRRQEGDFAKYFQEHEKKYKDETDKVDNWRKALTEAANLSSLPISKTVKESESAIISKIVKKIFGDVQPCDIEKDLIGIDSRINELDKKLGTEATEEVRIVGIWGMGGIGKTTVAEALFRRISYKFDGSSFVKDVREHCSNTRDICALQERIIGDILLPPQGITINDPKRGAEMIQRRFRNKKVLLVLDNVVHVSQLEFIAKEHVWFGRGSRINITTRDRSVLSCANDTYKPTGLLENEAIELFERHAFLGKNPLESYRELSNRAIRCAGYLPLALKVLGCYFSGKETNMWVKCLDKLEKTRSTTTFDDTLIYDTLKFSYNGLNKYVKKIFLDIACFFKGKDVERVTRVLDSFGFHAEVGIHALIEKALITVSNKKIEMHDLLQEIGWEIVSNENQNSRLWKPEEVYDVIQKNTVNLFLNYFYYTSLGSSNFSLLQKVKKIEGIVVPNTQNNVQKQLGFRSDVFESMKSLRLLDVFRKFTSCEPTVLPDELRWLCWNQYPFSSLPLADNCKLVGLEMHAGHIQHFWTGRKIMPHLKFIHLKNLESLKRFPDISGAPLIERLVLSSCRNLVEVHESLGSHKNLVYVDFSDCHKLKRFPSIDMMKSLETLILSRCPSLERFPEIKACMLELSNIHLDGCSQIEELPSSIRNLCNLSFLNLTKCTRLKNIPNSICKLKCLKSIHLHDCVELLVLPEEFGRMEGIEELQLGFTDSNTSIQRLPQSINFHTFRTLCSLRKLDLSRRQIENKDFPTNLDALSSLEELHLSGNSELTELPGSINHLIGLKHLELDECSRLRNLMSIPSGIQILRASSCNLLEEIKHLSKEYEWLYKIWLVGCRNLLDQDNETNPCKMLQLPFLKKCAALGHRLSIAIPGSMVPSWFASKQNGCDITLKLPPRWHSQIMGFAVSGVFSRMWNLRDDYPMIKFTIVNDGEHFPKTVVDFISDISSSEVDTLWIGYIPFSSFQLECDDWCVMDGNVTISIRLSTGQLPISCGAQIIFKENVESIKQATSGISDYWKLKCVSRKGKSFFYKDEFRNT